MAIKKALACIALGILVSTAAFVQEAGERVFAPFVSRLTAEVKNNLVRLSWQDSPDARGPVYVYRSARPIEAAGIGTEKPEEIPYGSGSYIDEPEGAGPFYYFVAASDGRGTIYDILIPLNNTISVNIQDGLPEGGTLWPGAQDTFIQDETAFVETELRSDSVI
ncbi:MAG: hypothetical protein LBH73_09325, partial [Spirochaetaceae bacterium]|nr:hypothetical protein [Spirochaetaceae bacterium]